MDIHLSTVFLAGFGLIVLYVLYTFVSSFFAMFDNYVSVVGG